jgi:hypothetical protein
MTSGDFYHAVEFQRKFETKKFFVISRLRRGNLDLFCRFVDEVGA